MARPFLVWLGRDGLWRLEGRYPYHPEDAFLGYFDTQGEAIDFAYKNWPWWP